MRLLLLGGTKFLGKHIAASALASGHEVTLFTRGETNPGLFPDAEHLRGDRDGNLAAIEGREWDAVVDTSGYVPRIVGASARLLAGAVERYVFISSVSVYADFAEPRDESSPVAVLEEPTEEFRGPAYGALKALCEAEVERALPGRALLVRPGLIVGPDDPTDRFTYWPQRARRGGEILAPAPPERPVQFIDVRDLAEWMVRMAEAETTGVFNATGRPGEVTFGALLETCGAEEVTWVDEAFLVEQGAGEWMELPLWISPADRAWRDFQLVDVSRALAAGLTFRPLAETVRDVPEWTGKAGLAPERENELLVAWHGR
ncbi:MAG: NAD-dependent epimerase/dehydratase family protein [Gaiellaceae bacterium]